MKLTTIIFVLRIVAVMNLHLEHLDIKTAFLHSDLENTYMMQLHRYIMLDKKYLVCMLKKSLWLEKAPRQ